MSEPGGAQPRWGALLSVLFLFFFLLVVLFSVTTLVPELLWRIPFGEKLGTAWFAAIQQFWMPFVRWVGLDLLNIARRPPVSDVPAPSVLQLVNLLCITVLAAIGATAWVSANRGRRQFGRLHEWLRLYVRVSLGILLMSYGIEKVLLNQFGSYPPPTHLMTPLGDFSLFSLLSAFMAAAPSYQVFAGAVELVAGVLILFRRTVFVGAYLAVAAMTHVMALNIAYHFTMYVLASSMLVMAAFLALPSLRRVMAALLSDGPISARVAYGVATKTPRRWVVSGVALILLLAEFGYLVSENLTESTEPPLYGSYDVESYAQLGANSDSRSGEPPWRWLAVDHLPRGNRAPADGFASIAFARHTARYLLRVDTAGATLRMVPLQDPRDTVLWRYSLVDPGQLVLERFVLDRGDSLRVVLRKRDQQSMPLLRAQPRFW